MGDGMPRSRAGPVGVTPPRTRGPDENPGGGMHDDDPSLLIAPKRQGATLLSCTPRRAADRAPL